MDKRICPMCGEEIAAAAKKCNHCGEYLEVVPSQTITASPVVPVVTTPQHDPVPTVTERKKQDQKSTGMVFCRGCGREIHESAPACPHCGALQGTAQAPAVPSQQTNDGPIWIPVISMIVGIICLLSFLDDSKWDGETIFGCTMLAVAGLVMGIISICKQRNGRGMAIAGVVLSAIALLICIGLFADLA